MVGISSFFGLDDGGAHFIPGNARVADRAGMPSSFALQNGGSNGGVMGPDVLRGVAPGPVMMQNGGSGAATSGSAVSSFFRADNVSLTRNGERLYPEQDKATYAALIEDTPAVLPVMGHYDWGKYPGGGTPAFWGPDRSSATADPVLARAYAEGQKP